MCNCAWKENRFEHVGLNCCGYGVPYGFVEYTQYCNFPSILDSWPVKCGQHTSNSGFSTVIV